MSEHEKKEKNKKYDKEWKEKQKSKALVALGNECIFCKSKKDLCCHNIFGRKHGNGFIYSIVLKNPDEYIRLCHRCHIGIHFCMKHLSLDFNQIKSMAKVV